MERERAEFLTSMKVIEGKRLDAVTFVMDYIQLQLDGSWILSLYDEPIVEQGDRRFGAGDPGFKDLLCSWISTETRSVALDGGERFVLTMAGGGRVILPIASSDPARQGRECMYLVDRISHYWVVLSSGELMER